jgi:membrane associated rhomboid family serine protease
MLYVEYKQGWKRTLIAYVVTGIWAVLAQSISTLGQGGLIGSSGCGFGMIGIACMLYYQDAVSKKCNKWLKAIGIVSFGIQLLCSILLYQYLAALFMGGNVAFLAHLGGLIGGLVMVVYWTKEPMIPLKKSSRKK